MANFISTYEHWWRVRRAKYRLGLKIHKFRIKVTALITLKIEIIYLFKGCCVRFGIQLGHVGDQGHGPDVGHLRCKQGKNIHIRLMID